MLAGILTELDIPYSLAKLYPVAAQKFRVRPLLRPIRPIQAPVLNGLGNMLWLNLRRAF